jgi:hypothetical protein
MLQVLFDWPQCAKCLSHLVNLILTCCPCAWLCLSLCVCLCRVDNVYGDRHLVVRLPEQQQEPVAAHA